MKKFIFAIGCSLYIDIGKHLYLCIYFFSFYKYTNIYKFLILDEFSIR